MISIIIPTWNRSHLLEIALQSIEASSKNCPETVFELVVIDNKSTDGTKAICKQYAPHFKNYIYWYEEEPGLVAARHKGVQLANGDVLCFLDEDVEVSLFWLAGMDKAFSNNKDIHMLTGPCLPKYQVYPPAWLEFFWEKNEHGKSCGWLSVIDWGSKEFYIDPLYVWGLNFAIRKATLIELGGFHPDSYPPQFQMFQGDGESGLSYKAIEKGYKAFYSPEAMLYHNIAKERLTEAYFDKRAFYQGICDSYTSIRRQHGLYQNSPGTTAHNKLSFVARAKKKIQRSFAPAQQNSIPEEILALKERFNKKYREGFDFHQHNFKENNDVKNWILKKDYFNYKLPVND